MKCRRRLSWGKLKKRSRACFIALNNLLCAHLQRRCCAEDKNKTGEASQMGTAAARGQRAERRALAELALAELGLGALLCVRLPQHRPGLPVKAPAVDCRYGGFPTPAAVWWSSPALPGPGEPAAARASCSPACAAPPDRLEKSSQSFPAHPKRISGPHGVCPSPGIRDKFPVLSSAICPGCS